MKGLSVKMSFKKDLQRWYGFCSRFCCLGHTGRKFYNQQIQTKQRSWRLGQRMLTKWMIQLYCRCADDLGNSSLQFPQISHAKIHWLYPRRLIHWKKCHSADEYVLLCVSQTFYEITSDVTLPTKAQHAHSCSKLSSFEEEHRGTCQGITQILSTGVLENMHNTNEGVPHALVMEKSNSAFVNRKHT